MGRQETRPAAKPETLGQREHDGYFGPRPPELVGLYRAPRGCALARVRTGRPGVLRGTSSCPHESQRFSCGCSSSISGIAFGAGLYKHRIFIPRWVTADDSGGHWNAEQVRRDNTGLRFWAYVTTGPLTLLALANLLAAWKTIGTVRSWWLAAALLVMADRVLTFSYLIPTMVGLMNAADSSASVASATRWAHLNYFRHGLLLGGWLAALKTFSLVYRTPRTRLKRRVLRRTV